jgi:hypothetical protein
VSTLGGLYTRTTALTYVNNERDEAVDFLRGLAIVLMTVVHIEYFSIFSLFAWERLGFVTAAEWFVALSGLVVGRVSRSRIAKAGLVTTAWKSVARGTRLYAINIALIVLPLALLPFKWIDTTELMRYADYGSGSIYRLYPAVGAPIEDWFNTVLLLRGGPHQVQVLGLYACLLISFVPPVLFALHRAGGALLVLAASWGLYAWNLVWPLHWSPIQFENAFPLESWQLLFVMGMLLGWFSNEIRLILEHGHRQAWLYGLCAVTALLLFVLAQGRLDPFTPNWATFGFLPHNAIEGLYLRFAERRSLGPLRILNDFCILVALHGLLRSQWDRVGRTIGRLFVPIGQAWLYCFVAHLFLVLIASQIVHFSLRPPLWIAGTAMHLTAICILWLLARYGPGRQWLR